MTATSAPVPATEASGHFEPGLRRRQFLGTIFYGACLASIFILLMSLFLILWDVLSQGVPWLDARFLTGVPNRFQVASGPVTFNSVLVTINGSTGRATSIQRVDREHV